FCKSYSLLHHDYVHTKYNEFVIRKRLRYPHRVDTVPIDIDLSDQIAQLLSRLRAQVVADLLRLATQRDELVVLGLDGGRQLGYAIFVCLLNRLLLGLPLLEVGDLRGVLEGIGDLVDLELLIGIVEVRVPEDAVEGLALLISHLLDEQWGDLDIISSEDGAVLLGRERAEDSVRRRLLRHALSALLPLLPHLAQVLGLLGGKDIHEGRQSAGRLFRFLLRCGHRNSSSDEQ
ncbi:hypothetical protein PENTCL1PPCAC_9443, partial [Pristionchus entomophagus]